jgi:hypothetical protein
VQRLARRSLALLACDDRVLQLHLQATAVNTRSSCAGYYVTCWVQQTAYQCTGRGSSRQSLARRPCGAASSTWNNASSGQPNVLVYDATTAYTFQFCRISIVHLHRDAAQRRAIRRHVEEHDCTSGGHASCQHTQPDEE